jgi:outer membrane protein assembly factor BamD (BamD/ComL family)
MAKKKVSRKELLKRPDEFMTLSGRAADYLKSHQKQLQVVGVAVVIIALVYLGARSWVGSINEEGQSAYNDAAKTLETAIKNPSPDPSDLEKARKSFEDVIENYSHSNAVGPALAQVARIRFLEKNYSEAISQYKKFLAQFAGDTSCDNPAKLALAACFEAQGDLKSAIETLNPLTKSAPDSPFRDQAMWQLGRLYKLDNQPEKSKEVLEKFIKEYPQTPYTATAKAMI